MRGRLRRSTVRRGPRTVAVLVTAVLVAGAAATGAATSAAAAPPVSSPAASAAAASRVMLSTPKSLGGWGVIGLNRSTSPLADFKSNVTALAEWNGRIYVGGMFTAVARNGRRHAAQPYLAAFNRTTGTWVSTFRPRLDGGVWDLAVTPKGQLLVAGYFGAVNGTIRRGLVALNPATGAVDRTWNTTLTRTTGRVGVRTLHVQGPWVYLGGNVTTVSGGYGKDVGSVRGKGLFKVKVANGRPNATFHPIMSTAPWQVFASPRGDRVYAAGRFGTVNGRPKEILAVLSPTTGALVPGVADVAPFYDCRPGCTKSPYSEAVYETANGAHVIATPTEHGLAQLDRATLSRRYGHYTGALPGSATTGGGDFQAIAETNGVVYASCHCFKENFSGATWTTRPGAAPVAWSRHSKINGIGAYDTTSFAKLDVFSPAIYGRYGDGVWQLFVDSTGCLWAGGDIVRTATNGWLGGFAKFCRT